MEDNILTSVKQMLGMAEDYTEFRLNFQAELNNGKEVSQND
nr:MAG TPA: hypothetical protein [Caudoviricetes sp.]